MTYKGVLHPEYVQVAHALGQLDLSFCLFFGVILRTPLVQKIQLPDGRFYPQHSDHRVAPTSCRQR